MTKDEALKLKLDALIHKADMNPVMQGTCYVMHPDALQAVIDEAIKQARSAPVQEKWGASAVMKPDYVAAQKEKSQQALDVMAENARELGLDYEPVPENFIDALKFDVAMREWVGLTPHERMMCRSYDIDTAIDKAEAKLKEKNT